MPPKSNVSFYAVQKGQRTGVYETWSECRAAISGVSGAIYQKFAHREEALAFVAVDEQILALKSNKLAHTFAKESDTPVDIYIYTDGACSNNGRPGSKVSIGIWFGPADPRNVSEALERGTNNIAELTAILRLRPLLQTELDAGKRIAVVSDSQYALRCAGTYGKAQAVTGWTKDIPNKELVRNLYEAYAGTPVLFLYVPAHTEGKDIHSVGNAGADALANQAIGMTECPYANKGSTRCNLQVPFASKEEAKSMGAKWDPVAKTWYCFQGTSGVSQLMERFSKPSVQ